MRFKIIPRSTLLQDLEQREDLRQSMKICLTAIVTTSTHLFILTSFFLFSIKEKNCKRKRMLFYEMKFFSFSDNLLCSSCSIPSPTYLYSEFYLPIYSPSLAVPFIHQKEKKQIEDNSDQLVSPRASSSRPL